MNVNTYVVAKTNDEAYQRLKENRKNKILGGGAWLKISVKDVGQLISLEALNLDYIREKDTHIEIGAMTTLRDIEMSPLVSELDSGILSEAISNIMGVAIRNLATIGGSVMGKFAFSDILPVLLVMDVKLNFHHGGDVDVETFLSNRSYQNDLLISLKINKHKRPGFFHNIARTHLDFSMINLAIIKGENMFLSVGSRPGLAKICHQTMLFLDKQNSIDDAVIESAASILLSEAELGHNLRASKDYRETLLKTYFKRGMKKVVL
ncbi:MAG TPA: FAD binding domain-containing protein [Candidatus Izemoplasmatales bacterium]|nr:FAD binding domain-containing protein [Candidatus Izemoplasmatales bacterium]